MKIAERIVMILLLLCLVGGFSYIYFGVQNEKKELRESVARGDYEIYEDEEVVEEISPDDWRAVYPTTIPVTIGSTTVKASIADTLSSRIKGLSNTPFLPDDVVKLFAFGVPGSHSIWMKDMNYSLDIMWVAEKGEVIHIEKNVTPETFPKAFESPRPEAWFVIEANSGFTTTNEIVVGDVVIIHLP